MPDCPSERDAETNMVFSVCCDLRAEADWRALADELLAGEEPRTTLGREQAAWLAEGH